jgi:hypothetical protein
LLTLQKIKLDIMIQLLSFTRNPFLTITTSKDSIQEFAYDNLKRMEAANNAAYAQLIVDTKAAWELVFGNLEAYDADRNAKKAYTIQVKTLRKEFIDKAVALEGLVAYKFKRTSDTYQLFYPLGRNEYHNATLDNILFLMKRMIDGTHAYPTELGADTEAEFTALRDKYQVAYDLQRVEKGIVAEEIPDYQHKVLALFEQLYKNMLVILTQNYKSPAAMLAFFDETIVNYVSHVKKETVQNQSRKVSAIVFGVDDTIQITSRFSKTLKYFFAETADADPGTSPNELASKLKVKIKGSVAGAPLNKFLIFINETDLDARVEVRLV